MSLFLAASLILSMSELGPDRSSCPVWFNRIEELTREIEQLNAESNIQGYIQAEQDIHAKYAALSCSDPAECDNQELRKAVELADLLYEFNEKQFNIILKEMELMNIQASHQNLCEYW